MTRISFKEWLKNLKLDGAISTAISFFMPGISSLVWVSLPFFLISIRVPLFYLGLIYSVGILGAFLMRIPLKFYSEKGRNDILPMASMLFAGISLSLFSISHDLSVTIVAFLVLSIAGSIYRASFKNKKERDLRNTEPMRNMYSQNIVPATGIFIVLIFSGVFPAKNIAQLYGLLSIVVIMIGFVTLALSLSRRYTPSMQMQSTKFTALVSQSLAPLKSLDRISERKLVFPFLAIQSLLYLSICIVGIFLPAMAINDGLIRSDVFFIFAAFSIIAYFLDLLAKRVPMKFVRDTFYMFRPIFLMVPFLILSFIISSLLFIIGYFAILLWVFSDSVSSDLGTSPMSEGDRIRSRILLSFISTPIGILAPVIGAELWMASPRLLYGVAMIPAAISLLIIMLMLERNQKMTATHTM